MSSALNESAVLQHSKCEVSLVQLLLPTEVSSRGTKWNCWTQA